MYVDTDIGINILGGLRIPACYQSPANQSQTQLFRVFILHRFAINYFLYIQLVNSTLRKRASSLPKSFDTPSFLIFYYVL